MSANCNKFKCDPTKATTLAAAAKIGPLDHSIFGTLWEVEAKDQSKNQTRYDVTDTTGPQEFHTDGTYLSDANG